MQRNPLFPRSFSRKQGAGFPLGADAERVASQSSANYPLHTERGASLNTGKAHREIIVRRVWPAYLLERFEHVGRALLESEKTS